MARENQGLQIALILFVMLTIMLSAATYFTYRAYDDANKAKVAAETSASKENQDARRYAADAAELKKLIGAAPGDDIGAISDTKTKDMEKYGANYPAEFQFYHPLLEKMQRTIDEKNEALTEAKNDIPKSQKEQASRMAAKDAQLNEFKEARDKAGNDLTSEQAKFQTEADRIRHDEESIQTDLQRARKDAAAMLAKAKAETQEAEARRKKLADITVKQATKIERYESGLMVGAANGELTWVNQRNSTVWINLGRADGLMRQVTFSVYPADVTDTTAKGAKKGGIEITQILGDHLAEARVLEDDMANPMLPGDKIYTPLWSPGERRHFALAGLMEIDNDGRSDLQTVLNLIASNGGIVDCYINDAGKQVGRITVNTNCLILGKEPDEKSDKKVRDAYGRIYSDADQLRLQKVQLGDFLQRTGWKNLSPVVQFGPGANPNDFRAKPEAGVPKKSTGNVSDLFQKRQPPKAPSSAY